MQCQPRSVTCRTHTLTRTKFDNVHTVVQFYFYLFPLLFASAAPSNQHISSFLLRGTHHILPWCACVSRHVVRSRPELRCAIISSFDFSSPIQRMVSTAQLGPQIRTTTNGHEADIESPLTHSTIHRASVVIVAQRIRLWKILSISPQILVCCCCCLYQNSILFYQALSILQEPNWNSQTNGQSVQSFVCRHHVHSTSFVTLPIALNCAIGGVNSISGQLMWCCCWLTLTVVW